MTVSSWMLYAALVGGLVTLAAVAIERMAAARGMPVRFVWLAALAVSIVLPVGSAARRLFPAAASPATVLPFTITLPITTVNADDASRGMVSVDRAMVGLWLAFSALLLLRLTRAVLSLRRTREGWHVGDVDGTRVRFSDNVGPAVIGLRSMDVVLPQWIMTLDPALRAIVLRHEEEHRTARDPYLLFAAGIAVALMPWNLALWLQARRMRLAIEMDCDGRVLRAHPSPERYGMLMLTIAQRRSVSPAMFAPMLSEPATQLERRIIAMRNTTRRLTKMTLYGGSAIAAAALLFACALQSDTPTGPSPSASRSISPNGNQTFFEFQVTKQVSPMPGNSAPRYPDMLRSANVEGEVLAQFVMDTLGHADMSTFRVLKSTHDLFTAAVRGSLPTMNFYPAEVNGRKVKQLVQMPFQFSLSHNTGTTAARRPVEVPATLNGSNQVLRLQPVSVTAAEARKDSTARAGDRIEVRTPNGPTRVYDSTTFREFQIEKAAQILPNGPSPRYPDMLRSAKVEGEVTAQFVVDANGRPEPESFKVLRTSHDLFTESVRATLPMIRFSPAQVGGKAVKQLVTQTFTFSLSKE